MRRSQTTRRRRTSEAMSLEQLEDWIDHLDPSPLVDGVSMLDGYLTATIVGPCSVNPYEWMDHVLGLHGDIGMAGTTQTAAIMRSRHASMRSARGWPRRRTLCTDL